MGRSVLQKEKKKLYCNLGFVLQEKGWNGLWVYCNTPLYCDLGFGSAGWLGLYCNMRCIASGLGCWNCIAREGFEWLKNCIAIGEVYCSLGVQWVNCIARRLLYCG